MAEPIRHEVKGAVWWYEADGAVVVKARQAHTLVELDVLQVDSLALVAAPLSLKQHLWPRSEHVKVTGAAAAAGRRRDVGKGPPA